MTDGEYSPPSERSEVFLTSQEYERFVAMAKDQRKEDGPGPEDGWFITRVTFDGTKGEVFFIKAIPARWA